MSNNMKVLITGGTGFIGSGLALRCLEKGDSVKVLGHRRRFEAKGVEVTLASVTDGERMFDLAEGVDLVYHLAAAHHEANVPDQRFWDVNVTGTKNVLEASVNAGVKRFIFASTIGVYGSPLEGHINEQSPLKPDNIYGITKLAGEKLVRSLQDKLPAVIVRISEAYGPGDRRLLKLFKAIKKNIFFMIGSGENWHHPIYIDDLIDGLLLAATVEEAVGKTFVLAGKEPVTTNEMVAAVADELETEMRRFRAPLLPLLLLATITEAVLRPFGIQPPLHRRRMDFFRKSFIFSQELSSKILGFIPRYSFREGVSETAKWYTEMGYL